jgi:hypothetical protein
MPYNIDFQKLLQNNNITFQDADDFFEIDGLKVPKDGYSDSLRLHAWGKNALKDSKQAACLMIPSLSGRLEDLSPNQQWAFKHCFDEDVVKTAPRGAEGKAVTPVEWGGAFQTNLVDYLDTTGYNCKTISLKGVHYYNIVLVGFELSIFQQANPVGFSYMEGCTCKAAPRIHIHAIAMGYNHCFMKPCGHNEVVKVNLAPPMSVIKALDKTLNIHQSSLFALRMKDHDTHKTKFAPPRAKKTPRHNNAEPAAASEPVPDPEDDESSGNGDPDNDSNAGASGGPEDVPGDSGDDGEGENNELAFPDAEAAFNAIYASNDLDYLISVRRYSPNVVAWQTLDVARQSKSGAKKMKDKLGEMYNRALGETISEKKDLQDLLNRIKGYMFKQARFDKTRWQYVGWCIGRLGAGDAKIAQVNNGRIVRKN